MKKYFFLAAVSFLCVSCVYVNTNYKGGKNAIKGEGLVVSKSFDLKDFDAIKINGNADVLFTQGENWDVTVRTQENVLDYLDYKVSEGVLVIEAKDRRSVRAEVYSLTIQAPALKGIEVNGSADFELPAGLKSDESLKVQVNGAGDLDFKGVACRELKLQVNGAADINAHDVDVETLKVEINGAGDCEVSGKAGEASFDVNGAGDIDATGLKVAGEVKQHKAGIASIKL